VSEVTLPLFPLSNVVLFPGCLAPLHVFEPRYRQMTAEALKGERMIGMVTVRPENVQDISGDPPLYEIGCAGFITRFEKLADGRYNVVLQGTQRFEILAEELPQGQRLYRRARAQTLEEVTHDDDVQGDRLRGSVIERLRELAEHGGGEQIEGLPFERLEQLDHPTFVNSVCQALGFPAAEKQGLLEANGVTQRLSRLEGLLAFHLAAMASPDPAASRTLH
jgi:Lon protease-like protein